MTEIPLCNNCAEPENAMPGCLGRSGSGLGRIIKAMEEKAGKSLEEHTPEELELTFKTLDPSFVTRFRGEAAGLSQYMPAEIMEFSGGRVVYAKESWPCTDPIVLWIANKILSVAGDSSTG